MEGDRERREMVPMLRRALQVQTGNTFIELLETQPGGSASHADSALRREKHVTGVIFFELLNFKV
jgi:hypothetical protein